MQGEEVSSPLTLPGKVPKWSPMVTSKPITESRGEALLMGQAGPCAHAQVGPGGMAMSYTSTGTELGREGSPRKRWVPPEGDGGRAGKSQRPLLPSSYLALTSVSCPEPPAWFSVPCFQKWSSGQAFLALLSRTQMKICATRALKALACRRYMCLAGSDMQTSRLPCRF